MKNPEIFNQNSKDPSEQSEAINSPDRAMYPDKNLKKLTKELHERYKPEIIFMTQTSATLLGWSIKEVWKKVWPSEKAPIILTINTREIQDKYGEKRLSKGDPSYDTLEEVEKRKHENRIEELEYLRGVLKEGVYDDSGQKKKENAEAGIKFIEDQEKAYADKNFSIAYGDMISPSGFSLQLSNEDWPEFINLKELIKNKLQPYGITGNIAIVDENAGFQEAAKGFMAWDRTQRKNVYEPKRGEMYDRNSQTLGIAKQAIEAAVKEMGIESKVVVAGYDPSGDAAGRKSGGPWTRYSEGWGGWKDSQRLPNGKYRKVKTHSEEGKIAKKSIADFKQIGRDTGDALSEELNIIKKE
jgi:hypothetical protein